MVTINWDEYKIYKKYSHKEDNFLILLDFIRSYYNMINTNDIYQTIYSDEIGVLMLKKRDIIDSEGLEKYLFSR